MPSVDVCLIPAFYSTLSRPSALDTALQSVTPANTPLLQYNAHTIEIRQRHNAILPVPNHSLSVLLVPLPPLPTPPFRITTQLLAPYLTWAPRTGRDLNPVRVSTGRSGDLARPARWNGVDMAVGGDLQLQVSGMGSGAAPLQSKVHAGDAGDARRDRNRSPGEIEGGGGGKTLLHW